MKKFQVLSMIVALSSVSAVALACPGGPGGKAKMDTNGDGKITLQEAQAAAKARFERVDANNNGVLTEDELDDRGGKRMLHADANKDGQVTLAESQAGAQAFFQKLDANKDGVLTQDEFKHGKRGAKKPA